MSMLCSMCDTDSNILSYILNAHALFNKRFCKFVTQTQTNHIMQDNARSDIPINPFHRYREWGQGRAQFFADHNSNFDCFNFRVKWIDY